MSKHAIGGFPPPHRVLPIAATLPVLLNASAGMTPSNGTIVANIRCLKTEQPLSENIETQNLRLFALTSERENEKDSDNFRP